MAPKLSPIADENWLTPDTEAPFWLDEKRVLMRRHRSEVFASLLGSEPACRESSQKIFAHLGVINSFCMETELEDAASHVSDDVCIMQSNDAGQWVLTAASLCAPTYWSLQERIGQSLGSLHQPLPENGTGLVDRIARVFSSLQPDKILERHNWTIQASAKRFTPTAKPLKKEASEIQACDALDRLYLRVERQTVLKLPETGAIIFTIRICMDPLRAVFSVPGAKGAFARAWNGALPDVALYKGWAAYQPLIAHILSHDESQV